MKQFLFTESHSCDERPQSRFNVELEARTWSGALRKAREQFGILGRIRCTAWCGCYKEYRLDGTSYSFVLSCP
jgi:hypothetical protein